MATQTNYKRTLTTPRIALMIIAVAAPLAVAVGFIPLSLMLGNGPGMPIVYIVVGIILMLFSIGLTRFVDQAPTDTGFAGLVAKGLGKPAGTAVAYTTTFSYACGCIALTGGAGYFTAVILRSYGMDTPWWTWSIVFLIAVSLIGRRGADLSSWLLTLLLMCEFGALLVLDVYLIVSHGLDVFVPEAIHPTALISDGVGVTLMLAFASYLGVESSIIYSREAVRGQKSSGPAIFLAVTGVTVFYLVTAWIIIGSLGGDAVEAATEAEGELVFALSHQVGGAPLLVIIQVFFCTSFLAAMIALHNATTRYMGTLAEMGLGPKAWGAVHPRHHGPYRSSTQLSLLILIVIVIFSLTGLDPYVGINSSFMGILTAGIVAMQALCSAACVTFFFKSKRIQANLWRGIIFPGIAGIALFGAEFLIIKNYELLAGPDSSWNMILLSLLGIVFVAGAAIGTVITIKSGKGAGFVLFEIHKEDYSQIVNSEAQPASDG